LDGGEDCGVFYNYYLITGLVGIYIGARVGVGARDVVKGGPGGGGCRGGTQNVDEGGVHRRELNANVKGK
tara:strand:- start:82 stop:291 length:210 start_codon:yes stop_codon:yes gene_type:complete